MSMSEKDREVIRKCRLLFLNDLHVKPTIDIIAQSGVMNERMIENINSETTRSEQIRTFLDILVRCGSNAMPVFKDSLKVVSPHLYHEIIKLQTADDTHKNVDKEYIRKNDLPTGKISDEYEAFELIRPLPTSDHEACGTFLINTDICDAKIIDDHTAHGSCNPFVFTLDNTKSTDVKLKHLDDDSDCSTYKTIKIIKGDLVFVNKTEILRIENNARSTEVKVWDSNGRLCLVPKVALRRYGDPCGESWFHCAKLTSRQAELILMKNGRQGIFLVYKTDMDTGFHLSMVVGTHPIRVYHYDIQENMHQVKIFEEEVFSTVKDLVCFYKTNRSRLPCRLRCPLEEADCPILPGKNYDRKWHIESHQLVFPEGDFNFLGKGQFGKIVRGTYDSMPVVVKFLKVCRRINPWPVEDFFIEAGILSEIDHMNVVQLKGFAFDVKTPFLVMEYLAGGSLLDALKNIEVNLANLKSMFSQILSALDYLASKMYIIHGDVAARNILVGESGCLKLADFGMARKVSQDYYIAESHEMIPFRWSAPEVLSQQVFSTKSDIWSSGIVLWEILSHGSQPYQKQNAAQVKHMLQQGRRLSCPDGYDWEIKDLFLTVIERSWKFNAKDRLSAADLLDVFKIKYEDAEAISDVRQCADTPRVAPASPTSDRQKNWKFNVLGFRKK